MSIFSDISNLSNKKRKLEVPAPDTKLLVRGIVLLALGLLGASVYWSGFDHSRYNFFDLLWKTGDSI